ncbi:glutamyl-tRNA reductase [Halorubrum sp. CSM-61]|uniref:glutamyl-tRNA reductase n=1 Tax=Halorubrum sp. CSM-61 TaxID=2485838 RepID=UPI000F4BB80D|nr:glutamyl-tRNA reductase [Halorubrum sp. CSM-61]
MSTDRPEGTGAPSDSAPDRSQSPPASAPDRPEPPSDPERLRRRLRRRTAEIERREIEEAVSALDARGDHGITEEQRETVRELGAALVEALTAPPERGLRRAARAEGTDAREREQKRARAIRRLFDIDEA